MYLMSLSKTSAPATEAPAPWRRRFALQVFPANRVVRLMPFSLCRSIRQSMGEIVNERVDVANLSRSERRQRAPELVAAWDREKPDDSYNGNTGEFWKAYDRARRAVMSPTYEWRGEH
jgi:hypothetical protein